MRIAVIVCFIGFLATSGSGAAGVFAAADICGAGLARQIPKRASAAPTGSELARQMAGMDDDSRESTLLSQLLSGNVPIFLRHLVPVTLSGATADGRHAILTLCVAPDYLATGSDRDFLLAPLRLTSALEFSRHYGFVLPTPKIVDAVYAQARTHLSPQPLPPGNFMRTPEYYWRHNELIGWQRLALHSVLGTLTAGDKKDLVLTDRLWKIPSRVAIYGWHRAIGSPIQPLSLVHGIRYADYSHGVRLVSATAYLNGVAHPLLALLEDPHLAPLVSSEGAIPHAEALMALNSVPAMAGLN